jgi:hypothetical protein
MIASSLVPAFNASSELDLFLNSQKGSQTDFVKVELEIGAFIAAINR